MQELGIIIVIESGDLEQKSKLLVESIRTFGGDIQHSKVWAVKPRKGKPLKKSTVDFLNAKQVEFIDIDLNRKWYLYGFANKIYATAYIEKKFGHLYDTLLFLDSDTIVIGAIDKGILENGYNLAIKPAEEKVLALSVGDQITTFWQMIYDSCEINSEKPWMVRNTVDQKLVKANFNSGVIFSKAECKLFGKWLASFEKLTNDSRAYQLRYVEFYLIEQALLGGTIAKNFAEDDVKLLDNNYNYPFHFDDRLKAVSEGSIKILHYHHLFQEEFIDEVEKLSTPLQQWLKNFLPLATFKDNVFKKYYSVCLYICWRLKNSIIIKLHSANE